MVASDTSRVVIGISWSVAGYQALRYAVARAREHHVPLLVVRAIPAVSQLFGPLVRDANVKTALADIDVAFTEALGGPPRDLPIQLTAHEGKPSDVLIDVANRRSDLLVIGGSTAGRRLRPWGAATARRCARRAQCPVVIVPPPSLARTGGNRRLARAAARGAEQHLRLTVAPDRRLV